MRYAAHRAPDPRQWLDSDEGERLLAVEMHHRRAGDAAPNPRLHALVHVILENQIAASEPPSSPTLWPG